MRPVWTFSEFSLQSYSHFCERSFFQRCGKGEQMRCRLILLISEHPIQQGIRKGGGPLFGYGRGEDGEDEDRMAYSRQLDVSNVLFSSRLNVLSQQPIGQACLVLCSIVSRKRFSGNQLVRHVPPAPFNLPLEKNRASQLGPWNLQDWHSSCFIKSIQIAEGWEPSHRVLKAWKAWRYVAATSKLKVILCINHRQLRDSCVPLREQSSWWRLRWKTIRVVSVITSKAISKDINFFLPSA